MTNDELLDLYSDYLISAFGQTTATGLAAVLAEAFTGTITGSDGPRGRGPLGRNLA